MNVLDIKENLTCNKSRFFYVEIKNQPCHQLNENVRGESAKRSFFSVREILAVLKDFKGPEHSTQKHWLRCIQSGRSKVTTPSQDQYIKLFFM